MLDRFNYVGFTLHGLHRCFSLNEPLDIIGTASKKLSRQFNFLQLAPPGHGVNGLDFELKHCGYIFRRE